MPGRKTIAGAISVNLIEDGVAYSIETSVESVTIAANATSATMTGCKVDFYMQEGTSARAKKTCYYALYRRKGTAFVRLSYGSYSGSQITLPNSSTTYNSVIQDAFVIVMSASALSSSSYSSALPSTYLAKKEISINKTGDTGAQGKMSRNIYFAGLLSELSGQSFTVTDYSAPYVNVGTAASPQCYVFVGANGTYTYPSSISGSNWALMTTDFKYLITQAVFSDFAKLGAAIFSGNYMMSQYGTQHEQASTDYQDFDPADIYDRDGAAFRPNILMDWSSGYAHFGGGNIIFFNDGGGQLAGGQIMWDLQGQLDICGVLHIDSNGSGWLGTKTMGGTVRHGIVWDSDGLITDMNVQGTYGSFSELYAQTITASSTVKISKALATSNSGLQVWYNGAYRNVYPDMSGVLRISTS